MIYLYNSSVTTFIMNKSEKLLSLTYLTNPTFSNILKERNAEKKKIDPDIIKKYKSRISITTNHYLMGGKSSDLNLDALFIKYSEECIKYLKLQDNVRLIQKDYIDLNKNTKKRADNPVPNPKQEYKTSASNNILFREKTNKENEMENFVIRTKHKQSKPIIPRTRELYKI